MIIVFSVFNHELPHNFQLSFFCMIKKKLTNKQLITSHDMFNSALFVTIYQLLIICEHFFPIRFLFSKLLIEPNGEELKEKTTPNKTDKRALISKQSSECSNCPLFHNELFLGK